MVGNLSFINRDMWNDYAPQKSTVVDFHNKMTAFGLVTHHVLADGNIHRCNDSQHKKGNDNGWYVCHELDGDIYGSYGSWAAGRGSENFHGKSLNDEESRRKIEAATSESKRKINEMREEAAAKAEKLTDILSPADPSNEYLVRKQIKPYTALQSDVGIVIPAYNWDGTVRTLQTIYPDGTKRFLKGGGISDAFHVIGMIQINRPVLLCEGFATGATLHECSGLPVIVAFDCGNLPKVARGFRANYSNKLIVCADKDPSGIGEEKANECVNQVNDCTYVLPEFHDNDSGSDFNDLFVLYGKNAVMQFLHKEIESKFSIFQWTANAYAGEAPEIDWLIDGSLPIAKPGILAAVGGIGKSFLGLSACLDIAIGNQSDIWGGKICKKGRSLMLTGEDDASSVHRRFQAIDPTGEKRDYAGENMAIVPMPSAGGVKHLIEEHSGSIRKSSFYEELKAQILDFKPLLTIVDPLQAFVNADVNSDPAAAQYYANVMAELCAETGSSIITMHHMTKDSLKGIDSAMAARQAIRGVAQLVDGMRWAYAMWQANEENARGWLHKCNQGEYAESRVILGAVVKANDKHNNAIHGYIRNNDGFLVDFGPLDVSDVDKKHKIDLLAYHKMKNELTRDGISSNQSNKLLLSNFGIGLDGI